MLILTRAFLFGGGGVRVAYLTYSTVLCTCTQCTHVHTTSSTSGYGITSIHFGATSLDLKWPVISRICHPCCASSMALNHNFVCTHVFVLADPVVCM